jgi:peptidyl-tRNA hydrolase
MLKIRNQGIHRAHEQLNEAYEKERKGRADMAWRNGVRWVVFKLQEGETLEEIIAHAEELGCVIDNGTY